MPLDIPSFDHPAFAIPGVFFDGSDGFMRGTWKLAENVDKSLTDDDALRAMVAVHVRAAAVLHEHQKYAIFSEHLADTTAAQQLYVRFATIEQHLVMRRRRELSLHFFLSFFLSYTDAFPCQISTTMATVPYFRFFEFFSPEQK